MKRELGFGHESATGRDGPLSSYAEWHALIVGLCCGALTTIVPNAVGGYLIGVVTTVSVTTTAGLDGHSKDVADETAYTLSGVVVGYILTQRVHDDE